jgi:hypothetical protein
MSEIIARRELIAVSRSGERFTVIIEIGKPVAARQPNGNWECELSISPPIMHRPMNVGGYDSLQALSLAISLAHFHLREFLQSGGRLLYPDTGEEFALDDGGLRV